jgi:transcriptional regulator with XRE-family HTH domain
MGPNGNLTDRQPLSNARAVVLAIPLPIGGNAYVSDVRQRVSLAMEMAGMTNNSLGERSGLGAGYVGRFLKGGPNGRGKHPRAETLLKMAVALGVSYEWLVTGRGSPKDPAPQADAITDAQPNRVPVYETLAFTNAPSELQAWFVSRRRKPDLSTEQWRSALDYANKLCELGLLDSAPRGLRGKPGK